MTRPVPVVEGAPLRVLLALVRCHGRDGRATVRSVAAEAGLASSSTALVHLRTLRRLGLAAWDETTSGTLRPLVRAVPFGAGRTGECE